MIVRISSGRIQTHGRPSGAPARDRRRRPAAARREPPETPAAWADESGRPRESLQLFVNGENVRYRGGLACPLAEGDEIYVIPLIAGG